MDQVCDGWRAHTSSSRNCLGRVKVIPPVFCSYRSRDLASHWELHRLYHRVVALPGSWQRSLRYKWLALVGWDIEVTESDYNALATPAVSAAALDPLLLLWQVLAVIAIGGLVLVVIFAIVEPGPLVKRRPFPHKRRSALPNAEQEPTPNQGGVDSPSSEDEPSR